MPRADAKFNSLVDVGMAADNRMVSPFGKNEKIAMPQNIPCHHCNCALDLMHYASGTRSNFIIACGSEAAPMGMVHPPGYARIFQVHRVIFDIGTQSTEFCREITRDILVDTFFSNMAVSLKRDFTYRPAGYNWHAWT
jgi:hypothetical protein